MRDKISLTETDKAILKSYISMAEGLTDYLGNSCEIIVHSLADLDHSVVGIYHGEHSKRAVGAPITDLALSMLQNIEKNQGKSYENYFTMNRKGQRMKSSTIAIRGKRGRVIGLLCINIYLEDPFADVIGAFMPSADGGSQEQPTVHENLAVTVDELIREKVEEVMQKVYNDSGISTNLKVKEITRILYQEGIFKLKNSVERTAHILGTTKNTIYMHLRNIKDEQKNAIQEENK